jgi:hypothetical protein
MMIVAAVQASQTPIDQNGFGGGAWTEVRLLAA